MYATDKLARLTVYMYFDSKIDCIMIQNVFIQ